jgi:glycosyltransferase involved in cell wall biosynthesis
VRLLLNFGTLKKGGGQTVALNYLGALRSTYYPYLEIIYLVPEASTLSDFIATKFQPGRKLIQVPQNPLKRIAWEIFFGPRVIKHFKIDIIYSYFGHGYFSSSTPQVIGSADSNLYFPEIDFWSHYKGLKRLQKKVIDAHRVYGVKHANGIIFENLSMQTRFYSMYYKKQKTKYIMPSAEFKGSNNITSSDNSPSSIQQGLFLCGWQLNKNIMLIPLISKHFRRLGVDFHFILTAAPDGSILHKQFMSLVEKYDVQNMISLIGPVSKLGLPKLYGQIDFVFLLSKLESFSNNIIESWFFKKVLLVADEPWSRAICGNSAAYVNRDSPEEIANVVVNLISNNSKRKSLINYGLIRLKSYPDVECRFLQEMKFLEEIIEEF